MSRKPPRLGLKLKDLTYLKGEKLKDYLTLAELCQLVGKDPSWIRNLEKRGTIPQAHRVQRGRLPVRLYSPEQVREIQKILPTLRPGRPRK